MQVLHKEPDMEHAINIHHNYCNCESCKFVDPRSGELVDKKLWVTRKGATSAQDGQYGIIPGSMGTGSYITMGKGESRSWSSCSHGAGRRMSRTKAFKAVPQVRDARNSPPFSFSQPTIKRLTIACDQADFCVMREGRFWDCYERNCVRYSPKGERWSSPGLQRPQGGHGESKRPRACGT